MAHRRSGRTAGHRDRADPAGRGPRPHPPTATPDLTEEESRILLDLIAKGSYFGINLATPDLLATFETLEASGVEIVQEPTEQPYGIFDCAVRDPAGNMVRIQQPRS